MSLDGSHKGGASANWQGATAINSGDAKARALPAPWGCGALRALLLSRAPGVFNGCIEMLNVLH